MFPIRPISLLALIYSFAITAQAQTGNPQPATDNKLPAYLSQYQSNAADLDAIMQVTRDFQAALISKDGIETADTPGFIGFMRQ